MIGLWGDENELRNGELGSGLWPVRPPKFALVGVVGADPSKRLEEDSGIPVAGEDSGALGVVGVVASRGCSLNSRPTFTDCTAVMTARGMRWRSSDGLDHGTVVKKAT